MNLDGINSLVDVMKKFSTQAKCIKYLEKVVWNDIPVSPFDPNSKVYKCKGGRYKCKNTGKYFNVMIGTIFEDSKIPLPSWFMAIYLVTIQNKGISSYSLAKAINVTQNTAWFLIKRIQHMLSHDCYKPMLENTIEADETFVGGKNKNRHKDKKVEKSQGRSFKDKTPVLGLLQRSEYTTIMRPHKVKSELMVLERVYSKVSNVVCFVVQDTSADSIQPLIRENVEYGSTLYTDEWLGYNGLGKDFNHQFVHHGKGEYKKGDCTTNAMEGFWTCVKRPLNSTYHRVSPFHLQKYMNEFAFRYNTRKMKISTKFELILQNSYGRIRYKDLIQKKAA